MNISERFQKYPTIHRKIREVEGRVRFVADLECIEVTELPGSRETVIQLHCLSMGKYIAFKVADMHQNDLVMYRLLRNHVARQLYYLGKDINAGVI